MPISPFPRPHCSSASTWATSRRTSIAPGDGSGGREKGARASASSPRVVAPGSRRPAPGLCRTTPGVPPRTADPGGELNTRSRFPSERVGRGVCNTMYVINATGVLTGEYRKAHLSPPPARTAVPRGTSARLRADGRRAIGRDLLRSAVPETVPEILPRRRDHPLRGGQWPSVRSSTGIS